jgi:hypothetical protein
MSKDPKQPAKTPEKSIPKIAKASTEVTETDLWDLDSDDSDSTPHAESETGDTRALPARRTSESNLKSKKPTERKIDVPAVAPMETAAAEPKPTKKYKGSQTPTQKSAAEKNSPTLDTETTAEPEPEPEPETKAEPSTDGKDNDTTAPDSDGSPAEKAPFLSSLTKIEKIAISALFAVLALAATFAIIHFSNRVPTRSPISEKIDYPVNGKLVEIRAASTYWRAPITSGENYDVVRRGTALIPVLKLSLHSKPCAIRVFFRDQDDIVIGDGITREISGVTELILPATAGFDEMGMHAAYRTGESEPWTVQVFEGPSRNADRKDFSKILDTQISTDRR